VQGFGEVAVKKCGECAGSSAAGAEEAEVVMDRTLRVEAVLRGREAQENGGSGE
jgi:hypothetical protein